MILQVYAAADRTVAISKSMRDLELTSKPEGTDATTGARWSFHKGEKWNLECRGLLQFQKPGRSRIEIPMQVLPGSRKSGDPV